MVNIYKEKNRFEIENSKDFRFDMSSDIYKYAQIKKEIIFNEEEYFKLVYQPQINVITKEVDSCEVLSRWNHPILGNLKPNEFLAIIKDLSKEVEFDLYVLKRTCEEMNYMKKYIKKFSVNMSISTFKTVGIYNDIYKIVRNNNIETKAITIEILDDMQLKDYDIIVENIDELYRLGFKVAIDDFGTGYSSYYRLAKLKVSEVKIPREFLLEEKLYKHENILCGMISMFKELECKIVIEGVETEEQNRLMKNIGADYIQGYLYSKPLIKNEFINFIEKYNYLQEKE